MIQIASIIKLPKEVKRCSERSELLKFFVENLRNKNDKKYPARMIAVKLAHIPTKDLYYFRSCCQDRINRGENWQKYFWGSLKVNCHPWQK